jgi:peptidoglycan/xylan/chitin deacetylase (PgdA/CDA1 family)
MSRSRSIVYLMYHEIELPGRPMCHSEPGYQRYVVRKADFEAQMRLLKSEGWCGQCVSDALANPRLPGVAITIDDGCETDLLIVAPLLRELGYGATFYITVGFLGRPGYLSRAQLRELADLEFEIGSHSMTHAYLPDLAPEQLAREISDSRTELSQITGRSIDHFSCPGGRWNPQVMAAARQAGYRSVATSRAVTNPAPTELSTLGRLAIMRETELEAFRCVVRGQGLWKIRLGDSARSAMKRILGNSLYDRVRDQWLDREKR